MPVPNSARHLAALLIILHIAVNGVYSQDQPPPYLTYCSGDNYTTSSPYESNLRRLISDLVSSTPTSASYFSLINSTTSPIIYGLAQCRPDVSSVACAACLKDTATAAPKSNGGCALKTSGYFRYDSCLLIYSDKNFTTTPQEPIFVYDLVPQNASSNPFALHIQTQLYTVMLSASKTAFRFNTSFAAKTSADVVDIYTMGWCSMDLSTDDCFECLKRVSGYFPAGKTRGTCATVSCVVKFDTQKFYGSSIISAELPEPFKAEVGLARREEEEASMAAAFQDVELARTSVIAEHKE
ncbi:Cysteine-rich repeat secretory protein 12 [Platanthera guangdongensis]|uniref:Cysteine-rich repeat secretory protein 12 n=1 Tax=Platanthera guangdongensis TaxID=2320717 RepID=A0ABR2MCS3_9ASPA